MQALILLCKTCRSFLLEEMQKAKHFMNAASFQEQHNMAEMKPRDCRLRDERPADTVSVHLHLQLASESEAWRPLRTVALT